MWLTRNKSCYQLTQQVSGAAKKKCLKYWHGVQHYCRSINVSGVGAHGTAQHKSAQARYSIGVQAAIIKHYHQYIYIRSVDVWICLWFKSGCLPIHHCTRNQVIL